MCKFFCVVLYVYLSKQLHQCTIFFLASWAIQLYHRRSRFWCPSYPYTSWNRPMLFNILQHFFSMFSSIYPSDILNCGPTSYLPLFLFITFNPAFMYFLSYAPNVVLSNCTNEPSSIPHREQVNLSLVITISMHVWSISWTKPLLLFFFLICYSVTISNLIWTLELF